MGFGRRIVRQTVRAATPRPVRKAMHPVRSTKSALTPRAVHSARRALYTATNPLGAAENAVIRSALRAPGRVARAASTSSRSSRSGGRTAGSAGEWLFERGSGVTLADQADAAEMLLADLMSVQRDKFASAQRPVIPAVTPIAPEPIRVKLWAVRRREAHWWQRSRRQRIRGEVQAAALAEAARLTAEAEQLREQQQADADRWWQQLNAGDARVVGAALAAAFSDNAAPVIVDRLTEHTAQLRVSMPGPEEMPAKVAHITPTGRSSVRAWKKAEFAEAYRAVLGAHLLATVREAWAVAPALREVNVVGQRVADGRDGYLFSVTLGRHDFDWSDDDLGLALLDCDPKPLRVASAAREIQLWSFDAPVKRTAAKSKPATRPAATSSSRQRMAGAQIVAAHGTSEAPAWVGRQGGAAGVLRDAEFGQWREWRYEVRMEPPASTRNWMTVEEFVAAVTG